VQHGSDAAGAVLCAGAGGVDLHVVDDAASHGSASMLCTCRTMLVLPELDPPLTTITLGVTVRT